MAPQQTSGRTTDTTVRANARQVSGIARKGIEEIWLEVMNKIQYVGIKEFLYQEGKLISVSFGAGMPSFFRIQIIYKNDLNYLSIIKCFELSDPSCQ